MERGISVPTKSTALNAVLKKPDSKNPQYYHQLVACCLVKPGKKEVLPLMPEPIIQQVDASKNDCEKRHDNNCWPTYPENTHTLNWC